MVSADDDEALIAAALKGSAYAWETLVKRYERRIYNHGLRLTGNQSDAMDLMQEVFLGVYRNLHRFRGDAKFSSWIFRIAHNKAMDMNRRRNLFRPVRSDTDEGEEYGAVAEDSQYEPDQRVGQQQENRQIIRMLSALPLEQRLIVELKIFQSLTFDEIAAMQEISENTAKTRFYAALKKLRTMSEEHNVLP
jgi:RNA polymerase sigma-70 factor (ECF subfamily)